jgi:alpha-glucosidase
VDAGNGVKVAVAESDIEDYPGLWLHCTGNNGLAGTHPPFPLKEVLERDRDYRVTETADYIAVPRGTRSYPWRLLGIAEKDGDLITNRSHGRSTVRHLLTSRARWLGLVERQQYSGVDFKSGINTQTYKYYIDFAAKYGLQYIVLDEGWYKLGDVMEVVPEINMDELTAYAKQKNVGIILWVVWKTLDDKFDQALDQFQKWGIKGIKIDFMECNDQADRFTLDLPRNRQTPILVIFTGQVRSP